MASLGRNGRKVYRDGVGDIKRWRLEKRLRRFGDAVRELLGKLRGKRQRDETDSVK